MSQNETKRTIDIKRKYSQKPFFTRVLLKRIGLLLRSVSSSFALSTQQDRALNPVFIISSGRSGTTLLRSMLVAGGKIAIPPETQNIHTLAIKFLAYRGLMWDDLSKIIIADFESRSNYFMWETNLAPLFQAIIDLPEKNRSLAAIIDQVYMFYAAEKFPDAKIWGDQSPIYTFQLPTLLRVFPHARFIHMLRDGRDVVSSMVSRHGDGYLTEAIYRWKKSIEITEKFQRQMPANRFIEVRYEHLVDHSEQTLQDICRFISIEFSSTMLEYWHLPSTVEYKHKSFHQNLSKPVFSSSVGKWRERLSHEQIDMILASLDKPLRLKGYID